MRDEHRNALCGMNTGMHCAGLTQECIARDEHRNALRGMNTGMHCAGLTGMHCAGLTGMHCAGLTESIARDEHRNALRGMNALLTLNSHTVVTYNSLLITDKQHKQECFQDLTFIINNKTQIDKLVVLLYAK